MKGTLLLVCAVFGLAAAQGRSILLESTFREDTEPGWVSEGAAEFTGGNQDPLGDGWLRLTPAVGNTTGFMYNTSPVPFDEGIEVEIEFKIWGWTSSSPADGFVFAFFDGETPVPTAGGFGGSLGYAQSNGSPGLTGAILGVGVDEFGNFSNPTEDRVGGPGFTPNAITIRGPGEGAGATAPHGSPNHGFLTASGGGIQLTSGTRVTRFGPKGLTIIE